MNNVSAFSRLGLECIEKFYSGEFIISITDPRQKPVNINQNEENILRLSFYDIDRPITTLDNHTFYPISDEDVDKIVHFIRENISKICILYVQCEAGLSRSAGIGAAISKYYLKDDEKFFREKLPNMYCYNKVLEKLNS